MFSQRLVMVHKAQTDLEIADANNQGAIKDHTDKLERIEALDAEIESFTKGMKEFGKPPESKQVCNITQTRRGPNRTCKMVPQPWAGETMQKQLVDTRSKRNAMDAEMAGSSKARDNAKAVIAKAQGDYQVAVQNSQLHSFASMLFRKPQSKVTDGEIATIQLFFVLIGALAGAVTATGLAYCSFTRHKEPKAKAAPVQKRTPPPVNIIPALRELATELKLQKAAA
jgi:hypothetical protein